MIQATLIQSIIYHVKRLFSADLMFVWGVLGIIVLYSGFLYVTTKGWLVTAEDRNDLVFADKNKKYGAYVIRKNYNRRLIFTMLLLVLMVLTLRLTMYVVDKLSVKEIKTNDKTATLKLQGPVKEKKEIKLQPKPKPKKVLQKTIKYVAPVISNTEDEPIPPPPPTGPPAALGDTTVTDGDGLPPPPPP
ncbi:MAG: hypothetical protein ACK5G8_00375, partial [Flavobacteriales bacterium]